MVTISTTLNSVFATPIATNSNFAIATPVYAITATLFHVIFITLELCYNFGIGTPVHIFNETPIARNLVHIVVVILAHVVAASLES